jgi:hypothetical protein
MYKLHVAEGQLVSGYWLGQFSIFNVELLIGCSGGLVGSPWAYQPSFT